MVRNRPAILMAGLRLERTRLIVLGRITAILPRPDQDLVRLQMNVVGGIDFDRRQAFLDAALFDSTIAAFRAQGKRAPRNPTHPLIFYTAGEITQRLISTDHLPYAERGGLWDNPDFARMRPLIREFWLPYLDGKLSLHDALRGVAAGW